MYRARFGLSLAAFLVSLVLVGCASRSGSTAGTSIDLQATAEAFQDIVETLAAPEMEGRDAGTDGIDLARDYLVDRFKAVDLEPGFVLPASQPGTPRIASYTQPFSVVTGTRGEGDTIQATVSNVGGILPGVGYLAEQVLVVGGHYDHVGYGHFGSRSRSSGTIHPGADDNASGTAGVILLAERMAAYAKANPDKPRRTILFTGFAAEERGLLGSRYMVSNPNQWPFGADDLAGMINLDMIGRLEDGDLYVFTDQTGDQWRPWLKQANQQVGLNLKLDVRPPGGSDHSLFISIQCPAIFLNTWLHPDYHTPADTPDKINAIGGAKVINLAGLLLENAATNVHRLVFSPPPPPAPRPVLGVQLDRQDTGNTKGAVIEDVLQDGPAEEAGIVAGDVIVLFAGKQIKNSTDLRQVLISKAPGDEVPITIIRDGKEVRTVITLGKR